MKKITIIICTLFSICFVSCEITDLQLQNDPNNITPVSAKPNFILNYIQVNFINGMVQFSTNTDDTMRYEGSTRNYARLALSNALEGEWNNTYRTLANTKFIEDFAENDDSYIFHRGIATLLSAYQMATLVDFLGDVPFSQAINPDFLNPIADDDATIYPKLIVQIDAAIADFNNATQAPETDLYYDGDASKWIKAANSLKLKLFVNMGDTEAINALLADDNLISSTADDFQFQYSTVEDPEDSRHTYFDQAYRSSGPSRSIGNYFIWLLKDSKTVRDPRLRYYLYRQTNTDPVLPCSSNPAYDFCYLGDFYWGRDHVDTGGGSSDRTIKTTWGLYPAGGAFDADNGVKAVETNNLGGAGIFPLILSSYVNFLKAEAALSLNTNGDALNYLEAGIRESMDKVLNFGSSVVVSSFAATQDDVDAYVDEVLQEYTSASSDQERLDIVLREYYLASYGNSIEAYNGYRRTGFPSNIQVPVEDEAIPFIRTWLLPGEALERNTSLVPRPITNQVFWDTLPAGALK
ncbi:SusD/RagB family nutrient-binding outer membrane lipoprotein [Flavivirga eckloniae]|uniref:SusD/RagB family nutrient-binding outer membrane lipoprotein n=1 Tax=Flavivirga eckloniae TaxID=1803846 RepID=A0A2K9PPZ7_9FLAO|nr:SusD/RagB family nutrient-binding outer membrane lipoprotein [Flavivirga eckloniae]AUP79115.1 hypothetical protein C1H87_10555 [Flavivirga eckloniae]